MNQYKITRQDLAANYREEAMCDCIETIVKEEKLFCFGAGLIGKNFFKYVEGSKTESKIVNYVDNNPKVVESYIDENHTVKIISKREMLKRITPKDAIIITVSPKNMFPIFRELLLEEKLQGINIYFVNLFKCKTTKNQVGINIVHSQETRQKHCVICERETDFVRIGKVARYDYYCTRCGSTPRQRAIVYTLNKFCSNWRKLNIHESSPDGAASDYICDGCDNYASSQFFPGVKSGEYVDYLGTKHLCQNIEEMSIEEETIDIFITQDVFEHVLSPLKAFKEIERVLKNGGIHIFTIPWFSENNKTLCRAKLSTNKEILYLEEPIYHSNPVDKKGSLVVNDWGRDIVDIIYEMSKMYTSVFLCENDNLGIEGDFLEVFISRKNIGYQKKI